MTSTKKTPEQGLVPDQFPELNRSFYSARPWDYFNHRNHLLMLVAGAGDRLVEIAKEGVEYKGLKYRESDADDEPDAQARENFVMADSEALLHHASETLLRLYLAHEELSPCPWLGLARIRSPGQFKSMVEERFLNDLSQDERRRRVATVFFGTDDRGRITPSPPLDVWNAGLDNIEAFLTHFARHFLNAGVYNALKHGLAVRPGEQMTQIDDGKLIKADGPAIEYLCLRPNADGVKRWHQTVSWLRPDLSMGLTYLAARLMESLWLVAKGRYLDEKPDSLDLWTKPVFNEVVSSLKEGEAAAVTVDSMHIELLYFVEPDGSESRQG